MHICYANASINAYECICPYIYTHMYIHIHKYFLIPTWIKHASTIRNSTDIAFLKYICGEMSVFSQG